MTSKQARTRPPAGSGQRARDGDATAATFGYLGAIFLGPVIPLAVYLLRARRSPLTRYHAATAVNLSLTVLLYAVCCLILGGLLALDSVTVALAVMLPVFFAVWVVMLRCLVLGAIAANRGERQHVPGWICATMIR
jgi:uncharacterized Tic20 family protein